MATTSDSPLQMPARRFTADEKQHRAGNKAVEQFANLTSYGTVPIGGAIGYGGTVAPPGWLAAGSGDVSRRAYKELFSVYGTTYGVGDGSTTFGIPTFAQARAWFGGTAAAPASGMILIRTGAT